MPSWRITFVGDGERHPSRQMHNDCKRNIHVRRGNTFVVGGDKPPAYATGACKEQFLVNGSVYREPVVQKRKKKRKAAK